MTALLGSKSSNRRSSSWSLRSRRGRLRLLLGVLLLFGIWLIADIYGRVQQAQLVRGTISASDISFTESSNLPVPDDAISSGHYGLLTNTKIMKQCSIHGWRPFSSLQRHRRKVYDLFMISNELDWLEIRLNELHNYVDYFVILESATTFTGLPKPLHLKDNWDRFAEFHSQIIYHELQNPPMDSHSTWVHEDFQRNAMFTQVIPNLVEAQAANIGDVILVSDIDEIPRPASLQLMRFCEIPRRLTLRSRFYYYSFQFLHRGPEWAHPQATTYQGPDDTILPADLRNGEGGNRVLNWLEKGELRNAAWHCSSCFATIDELLTKMASFSHTSLNQEPYRDRTRIVDRVRKGLDLWDRPGEFYDYVHSNGDTPKYLQTNRDKFAYLLDRSTPSAGFQDVGNEQFWYD